MMRALMRAMRRIMRRSDADAAAAIAIFRAMCCCYAAAFADMPRVLMLPPLRACAMSCVAPPDCFAAQALRC